MTYMSLKFRAVIFAVCYQLGISNTDYYYHLGLFNYDQNLRLDGESKNNDVKMIFLSVHI